MGRRGKNEGKREERGPKAHSKNSEFGTLRKVLFSGLPTLNRRGPLSMILYGKSEAVYDQSCISKQSECIGECTRGGGWNGDSQSMIFFFS